MAKENNKTDWDKKELGVLWKRTAKTSGEAFLTGKFNLKEVPGFPNQDIEIIVFSNKQKKQDNHPDLRIYLSEKREGGSKPTQAPAPAQTAPVANAGPDQELI